MQLTPSPRKLELLEGQSAFDWKTIEELKSDAFFEGGFRVRIEASGVKATSLWWRWFFLCAPGLEAIAGAGWQAKTYPVLF